MLLLSRDFREEIFVELDENILVKWLSCLTLKQVTWVQSLELDELDELDRVTHA